MFSSLLVQAPTLAMARFHIFLLTSTKARSEYLCSPSQQGQNAGTGENSGTPPAFCSHVGSNVASPSNDLCADRALGTPTRNLPAACRKWKGTENEKEKSPRSTLDQ